jgi:DNA-binding response OmpR family regulator
VQPDSCSSAAGNCLRAAATSDAAHPTAGSGIKIIMLSAKGRDARSGAWRSAPPDTKPFSTRELMGKINALLSRRETAWLLRCSRLSSPM